MDVYGKLKISIKLCIVIVRIKIIGNRELPRGLSLSKPTREFTVTIIDQNL